MLFGKSGELKVGDPVLAASFGGRDGIAPAFVVSRREFAGSWEYLVDGAIYTAPAHSHWSGAALITKDGKLVGVGSLIVGDASGNGGGTAGNMYVPTDILMPIMADLIANGAAGGAPKPSIRLGARTHGERMRAPIVSRVTPNSPAEKAGLRKGDVITSVGGANPKTLPDFYRKLWSLGSAASWCRWTSNATARPPTSTCSPSTVWIISSSKVRSDAVSFGTQNGAPKQETWLFPDRACWPGLRLREILPRCSCCSARACRLLRNRSRTINLLDDQIRGPRSWPPGGILRARDLAGEPFPCRCGRSGDAQWPSCAGHGAIHAGHCRGAGIA